MTESRTENPFVFVLGAPRSGTTLLLRMLVHGQPHVAGPERESQFYSGLLRRPYRPETYREDPYFRSFLSVAEIEALFAAANGPVDFFRRAASHLLEREGKRRFVEKSPPHTLHWREIVRDFGAPRLLLVVRDPRAVIHSMITTKWSHLATDRLPGPLRRSSALRHVAALFKYHQYTRDDASIRDCPNCLVVRFEDVVGQRMDLRRTLEEWLGVPMEELFVSRPFSAEVEHKRYELDATRVHGFEQAMPRWAQRAALALFQPGGAGARLAGAVVRRLVFDPVLFVGTALARVRGGRA